MNAFHSFLHYKLLSFRNVMQAKNIQSGWVYASRDGSTEAKRLKSLWSPAYLGKAILIVEGFFLPNQFLAK